MRASLSGRPPAAQTGRGETRADATRRDPSGINRARLAVVRRSTVPRTTNEVSTVRVQRSPHPCTSPSRSTAPAGTRRPGASPTRGPPSCSPPRYWADLVAEAERGLLDFVTIEDALGLQSDDRYASPTTGPTRSGAGSTRCSIAARVAPLTRHIGLVPTAVVTHTEPFHLSKAIATLDYVSTRPGRGAGPVSPRPTRPRTSAAGRSPQLTARRADTGRAAADRRPVRRGRRLRRGACAGCGTAGRTTPRSATSPPAGSSTGTSCTTSTSRAAGSASRARRSRPGRRRASRSSPRSAHADRAVPAGRRGSADVVFVTPHDAADAAADRRRGPRRAGSRRPSRRDRCTSSPTSWCSSTTSRRRGRARKARLDELRRAGVHQRRRDLHRHPGAAGRPAAGVAAGGLDRLPAAARRVCPTT